MKINGSKFILAGIAILAILSVSAFALQQYNIGGKTRESAQNTKFAHNDFEQNSKYKKNRNPNQHSGFDFYVLALSWSPSFCQNHPGVKGAEDQCKVGARRGFVVHGLWPQFEHGYPSACPTDKNGPDAGLVSQMLDIMPSSRLVRKEWQKHGTCTDLDTKAYFNQLRKAYSKVKIPEIAANSNQSAALIEQDFIKANYGLEKDGIAVIRENNLMSEVRICMDKELQFRTCDEVNSRAANDYDKLYIPKPK